VLAAELRRNIARLEKYQRLYGYYPDNGPLRRALYPRHMEFFAAGGTHEPMPSCPADCDGSPHRDRAVLAANRVGKTEGIGGYEVALHLTGRYPAWWPGTRFDRPVDCWAAGKSNETTRDIIQKKLFGPVSWRGRVKGLDGTGLVPAEDIGAITWKRGIADFVDTAKVRHRSGGWSSLGLKSYEQGRGGFEGTEKDLIWDDEEPPQDIREEQGIRLMTRRGHMLSTFTPMEGMSAVVREFLPQGGLPPRYDERAATAWYRQMLLGMD
jgi:phage terminase large subunit-like protein